MSSKTILDSSQAQKTELDQAHNPQSTSLALTTFRGSKIVEEFEAIGAEADVYLVEKDNKQYFLKLYRRGIKLNKDILKTIQKLSRNHKFFAELFEYGFDESAGRYYELSEYIQHGSLDKVTISSSNVNTLITSLNESLSLLHQNQIIHRDLKPNNILLRSVTPLNIVLVDFGVSSVIQEDTSMVLTAFKGTYAYAAPEVMSDYFGKEVDYWSLGMILLELLDKNPLVGLNGVVVLHTLATKNIDIPHSIDIRLQLLLIGLLTRDPKKRWGYAQVEEWIKGKTPVVYFDETLHEISNTLKYKFKNNTYTRKELVQEFVKEGNFEHALKHIGRGKITTFLEDIGEVDEAIKLDEAFEKPIEKLIYFIYSQEKELPFSLYGVVVDEDYLFNLLIKFAQHSLNATDQKIFDLLRDDELSRLIQIYEENNDSGLKEFVDTLPKNEHGIYSYLDVDKAIQSQDIIRLSHIIRYKEEINQRQIDKLIALEEKEIVQLIIEHCTLNSNHIKSIFFIGFGNYLNNDLIKILDDKTEVILNLIEQDELDLINQYFTEQEIVLAASSIIKKDDINSINKSKNYKKIRIVKKASQNSSDTIYKIKSFVRLGLDGNTKNNNGQTLFELSVEAGNDEIIEMLSETVELVEVSEHLKEVIISYDLLNLFIKLENVFQNRDLSLYSAVKNKAKKISSYLVEKMHIFQDKLLFLAIATDQLDIIRLLHKKGVSLEIEGKYGDKPIVYAFEKNRREIVEYFIDHNTDTSTNDKYGNTLLMLAVQNNWDILVNNFLHNSDISIDEQNDMGNTALHYAMHNNNINIVNVLLGKNVNISLVNRQGETALHFYLKRTKKYDTNIVFKLLKAGLRIDIKDKSGRTAQDLAKNNIKEYLSFFDAYESNDMHRIYLLLDSGLDLSRTNKHRETPLMVAIKDSNEKLSEKLISHGADINQALHYFVDNLLRKRIA